MGEDVSTSSSPAVAINSVRGRGNHMVASCQLKGDGAIVDARALINCGADGVFMHKNFAKRNKLTMITLESPIIVKNVDGTRNINGDITHMVRMEITIERRKHMQDFLITNIADNEIILGITWLKEQNPLINWKEATLSWNWDEPEEKPELLGWIKGIKTSEKENLKEKVPKDRKSTRLNSSHSGESRMPSSA